MLLSLRLRENLMKPVVSRREGGKKERGKAINNKHALLKAMKGLEQNPRQSLNVEGGAAEIWHYIILTLLLKFGLTDRDTCADASTAVPEEINVESGSA